MDELLKQREIIEVSLRQSIRELSEMGVGPEDSLLDSEGFPRVDIDLYRVRSLRSSIASKNWKLLFFFSICICVCVFTGQQNDYKAVMKLIEEMLPKVLPSSASAEESISMGMKRSSLNDSLEPFAKIGVVPIDSLAFKVVNCSWLCGIIQKIFLGSLHE